MNLTSNEDICCLPFDPAPWDDKIHTWENKLFIKDKVFTFMYMPVNYGKVITRLSAKAEKQGTQQLDSMCLSEHTTLWNMNLYLAVNKKIEDAENIQLSGLFYSKVYDGIFKNYEQWYNDF
jgi:hypothetical protein